MSTMEVVPGSAGGLPYLDAGGEITARSPLQLFWRRFRQDRVALASLVFIALLIVIAIAAPLVVNVLGSARPVYAEPEPDRLFRAARSDPAARTRSASTRSGRT